MSLHSSFTDTSDFPSLAGLPLLPLDEFDFVKEGIDFYRANIHFKNYPLESEADKLIVLVTVVFHHALKQLHGSTDLDSAQQKLAPLGQDSLQLDKHKFLGSILTDVQPEDKEELQVYLKSVKDEVLQQLMHRFYDDQGQPMAELKFWTGLAKSRSFLGLDYS